eukprot:CAMPEP_0171213694 /NCGR_PEP_ID=MMETSP0790-20130122/30778_1 /TAXON_ID=2925 /ORGANISM="Alexandrium catenella, Strain OF101" /LENGTH=186 /DNA_ID=CAMNT_0011679413 /DNA_START=131 /DNA_END=691 /DNA_ORIENTATION=+
MEVDMHAALTYSPTKPHYADEVAALSDEDCPSAERADSTTQLAETSSRASEPSSEESPDIEQPGGPCLPRDPTERVRSAVERAQAAMQMEVQAQRPQPEVQRKVRRYLKRHGSRSEAASPQSRPPSAAPLHELEADEEEEDLNLLDTPPETPYSSAETSVKADLRVLQGKVQSVPRHQMLGTLGGM